VLVYVSCCACAPESEQGRVPVCAVCAAQSKQNISLQRTHMVACLRVGVWFDISMRAHRNVRVYALAVLKWGKFKVNVQKKYEAHFSTDQHRHAHLSHTQTHIQQHI